MKLSDLWAHSAKTALVASLSFFSVSSYANELEEVEVIGVTPTGSVGIDADDVPFNVQKVSDEDLDRTKSLGISDFLNENLGSVTINDAQNNPLQADVQYRGFTLSPLLGLPQGLAVYQDGVRINEPFGDTMNWDILPESSIANIDLLSGANPLFGLNTLGGALSVTTKNGFTHPGHSIEVYGGSFDRVVTTVESGGNNGTFAYYITGSYFDEEGWRDDSPSDSKNVFASVDYEADKTSVGISLNYSDTDLIGNGAVPVELTNADREAIFTSPDQTENELVMLNLKGEHWLSDTIQFSGNAFYRYSKTDTFNGDGSEFEECDVAGDEVLVEGFEEDDFGGVACDDAVAAIAAAIAAGDIEVVEDQFGADVDAENANGTERDAVNNVSNRIQNGYGATFQTAFLGDLFGKENNLVVGASYQQGVIEFTSVQEIATLASSFNGVDRTLLTADRSTIGTGLFAPEEGTEVKAHNRNWSIYFTDTMQLTDQLALTVGARYNNTHVVLGDRSSQNNLVDPDNPTDLNGEHDFNRINPSIGLSFDIDDFHNVYGSYSESSRAPTPIELLCAREDAPCSLPNAFLADPPLEQVVTRGLEGGFRGVFANGIQYSIGAFYTLNFDDIIFTSTGGVGSNEGFFQNIGKTQRVGAELALAGLLFSDKLSWQFNYGFVSATYESAFQAASANHPQADANGEIAVTHGDRIPGIPEHNIKLGLRYAFNDRFSVGGNIVYNSDQFLRGDEANLLETVDAYAVLNLNASYNYNDKLSFFARVNNVLDTEYESFGLLGEAGEIFGGPANTFTNNIFLGPGAPINAFVGAKLSF